MLSVMIPDDYTMQDFHDFVRNNPDWYTFVVPSERQEQLQLNAKGMLQCRDNKGRSIYLIKLARIDAGLSNPKRELQFDEMWFESVLDDIKTQANGVSVIVDVNGFSWKLFRWLTPGLMKVCLKGTEIYPCKEYVYHIVNTSGFLNAAIKLVWPFLSEKIKKQTKFHFNNWNSLHEHISAEVLPPEYGGSGPDIDFEDLTKWLLDQEARIRKNLEYRQNPWNG
ncbi:hypothetical protein ILUMI_03897 [Ignelater luminosus]|uniref:CRAL-TRIO domain-containing protein n=1 Tax=Ignelater luminosus TaxID=2038154 RepID=A0A8K0DAP1_IGNLU|nr:hypothetical protein ILUMI_03897 [Ignelater luminosus]